MENIFKIKNGLVLLTLLCFNYSSGQQKYNPEYSIAPIPQISRFEEMTQNETRIDTLMARHNKEKLQRMLDGTAFIEGVSAEDRQKAIEYQTIHYQRYKDNRSRYYLDLIVNDKKSYTSVEDRDTLTTECSCYLSGDTIKVKMGIWVFGGFAISIDITKKKFTSSYWEDTHKQPIYKANLTDSSLVDNILVENETQSLILESRPAFKPDENIFGYLTFATNNYYRTSEYESGLAPDNYSQKTMDKINRVGSLYFKCKLREKTIGDE